MILFESFYAQEWVQVTTAFIYVIFIFLTPFAFWRASNKLAGEVRYNYINLSLEIYINLFLLLIVPMVYLVLFFFGSESKFMLSDTLPWVCLVGGATSFFDFIRSIFKLNVAKEKTSNPELLRMAVELKKSAKLSSFLSLIILLYGLVMVGVTNLIDTSILSNTVWFITFIVTGFSIIFISVGKSVLYASQAYATVTGLGEKQS